MNSNALSTLCDEFGENNELEGNDDGFDALGSLLSWNDRDDDDDDEDENNNTFNRVDATMTMNPMMRPPELVEFSKDGGQFDFTQNSNNYDLSSRTNVQRNTNQLFNTNRIEGLQMQLPQPTPILNMGQQQQQQQQQPANPIMSRQDANTSHNLANHQQTSNQQQQQPQPQQSSNQQQQFMTGQDFAQLIAQQFPQLQQQQQQQQQQQNVTSQQQTNQPVALQQGIPNMAANQQQMQLRFTADPNAFLQQLQFATFQQQMQNAQAQQQQQQQQQIQQSNPQQIQQQLQQQMQQQLQAQYAQVAAQQQMQQQQAQQKTIGGNIPLASAPSKRPAPVPSIQKPPPPKKARTSRKPKATPSTKGITKAAAASNAVSASDTDGEASKRAASTKSSSALEGKKNKDDQVDTTNMSPSDKAKVNRDRNREHARNTRLRKKAYLEKLKMTVDELCRERDTLVLERASAANLLVEMHNTRTEVLMSYFALRTTNEKRRKIWASILDESCFTCVMPVTPYRSFPASEVQVSKCQRTVMGIDGMMADTASLHVLLDSLVDRENHLYGKINFRYTLVTEETVVAGNQMMARWIMTTTNATEYGAKMEVAKQGMLCCKFNSAHKITGLELMFDVMAFMLQLKQAACSEGFSVIPNTVQTCQRSFDKPMVLTLAEPPYTIIQVNKLWEDLNGYLADEVVGKASCSILQSPGINKESLNNMMQEIRFKRPASAVVVNTTKSGELVTCYMVVFPLSTDSRILYYLGLTMYSKAGAPVQPNDSQAQTEKLSHQMESAKMVVPGRDNAVGSRPVQFAQSALPSIMFPGIAASQAGVGSMAPQPSPNPSSILNDLQKSGSVPR